MTLSCWRQRDLLHSLTACPTVRAFVGVFEKQTVNTLLSSRELVLWSNTRALTSSFTAQESISITDRPSCRGQSWCRSTGPRRLRCCWLVVNQKEGGRNLRRVKPLNALHFTAHKSLNEGHRKRFHTLCYTDEYTWCGRLLKASTRGMESVLKIFVITLVPRFAWESFYDNSPPHKPAIFFNLRIMAFWDQEWGYEKTRIH